MPALVSTLDASSGSVVNAYTDETEPGATLPLSVTDPNRLLAGITSSNYRRIWFAVAPGLDIGLPPSAVLFSAVLKVIAHIPSTQPEGSPITLTYRRLKQQYSVTTITADFVYASENSVSNWPLEELGTQIIEIPATYSPSGYPYATDPANPPLQTHWNLPLDLDISSWMNLVENDRGQFPSIGFMIECSALPDCVDGSPGSLIIDPMTLPYLETPDNFLPEFVFAFGYPVETVQVQEITADNALITWPVSPGADYYEVQYSRDSGVTWTDVEFTYTNSLELKTDPSTVYSIRVAAGYEKYGRCGTFSVPTDFLSSSLTDPASQLDAPPAPGAEYDTVRQQTTITFPSNAVDNPSIDRWQIARQRLEFPDTPIDRDIIADLAVGLPIFVDRYPNGSVSAYSIRGRIDPANDVWTPWSQPTVLLTKGARSTLLWPNTVLELSEGTLPSPYFQNAGAVEMSADQRLSVLSGQNLELLFYWRAVWAPVTTLSASFRWGFRFYDLNGLWLTDIFDEQPLDYLNDFPNYKSSFECQVPGTAAKVGCFFEFNIYGTFPVPGSSGADFLKVRIERVEVYRKNPDKDTGWEYFQIPDKLGRAPDIRPLMVDQTAFSYTGVGFGPLTAAPTSAPTKSPYRETSTPQDSLSFFNVGASTSILLYGVAEDTVYQLLRLSDSSLELQDPTQQLWDPLVDAAIGTFVLGPNLIANGDTDISGNTDGWTGIATNTLGEQDLRITTDPGTFVVNSSIVLLGGITDFALTPPSSAVASVAYPIPGITFFAGHTYQLTMQLATSFDMFGAPVGLDNVDVIFGTANLISYGDTTDFVTANIQGVKDNPTSQASYVGTLLTMLWTPRSDTTLAFVNVTGGPEAGTWTVYFDKVQVKEVIGYLLPAVTDFQPVEVTIPGYFSSNYQTAYQLVLVSGKMRPYGMMRDSVNVSDLTNNFDTALHSLGNLRTATGGELELRSDLVPPRVNHYMQRGVDHSTVAGGLDLRYGKNVSQNTLVSDPSQVINRLLMVGYGSDRFQLVYEVRSVIDRLGRLPSDPHYRFDAYGNPPDSPGWDFKTGGTSEEIYGIRYGVNNDQSITTRYQASVVGQQLVELAAWPLLTFSISAVDLGEVPAVLDVGDFIPVKFKQYQYKKRITQIVTDVSQPRLLQLTLGELPESLAMQVNRIQKDLTTSLTFINSATGSAVTGTVTG